jgi:hypothetical protein
LVVDSEPLLHEENVTACVSEEGKRFRIGDANRFISQPANSDSRAWKLAFETPEGDQITVELSPEVRQKLLSSIEEHAKDDLGGDSQTSNKSAENPEANSRTRDGIDPLPTDRTLALEEYLNMHRALTDQTRYQILWLLVKKGEMSLEAIERKLDLNDEGRVADHIEALCDATLIERWKQTDRGSSEIATTYRPTIFGRTALTDGIHELLRNEWEFGEMYSGDDGSEAGNR